MHVHVLLVLLTSVQFVSFTGITVTGLDIATSIPLKYYELMF
jgi:hypothetical protein